MQKWYLIAILAVLGMGCALIIYVDQEQPANLNVKLFNEISGLITTVLTTLLVLLGNSAKVEQAKNEVVVPVKLAAAKVEAKADELASTAKSVAEAPKELKVESVVIKRVDVPPAG